MPKDFTDLALANEDTDDHDDHDNHDNHNDYDDHEDHGDQYDNNDPYILKFKIWPPGWYIQLESSRLWSTD